MTMKQWPMALAVTGAFVAGFGVHSLGVPSDHRACGGESGVRDAHLHGAAWKARRAQGPLPRSHDSSIFNKHDMTSIGYWIPQDAPLTENTLIYVLAHPSREDAKKNWAAFQADPEWVKAKAESEKDGKIVEKAESVFMDPTDFSQIK